MPTYKRNVLIRSWRRRAPTAPRAKLDEKYKRLRRVVACWRTKRSGIMREMSLSMRVPSVAPCGAVPWVPSNEVQRGNGIGETP